MSLAERLAWHRDERLARYVALQTCAVLRDQAGVDVAAAALHEAGLPVHPDRPKNWDTFLAVYHAMSCAHPDGPVLDAGGERYSAFLPALSRLGWTSLTAVNLEFSERFVSGGVAHEPGDITATVFPYDHFQFVGCLSVLEHGVDISAFLFEMARIMRSGARLLISFDYWAEPIATNGLSAYGSPVRIFDAGSVRDMIETARTAGFALHRPFAPECLDRVVHWRRMGLRYTFANLLFRLLR